MSDSSQNPKANLIVNYLPPSMTEDQLNHLFSPYGSVEAVKIIKDKGTNRSLGYGFIKFATDEQAKAAIAGLNGRQIESKTLKVAVSKPPGSEKNSNLYIAGLEPHITKEDLHTLFQAYGQVMESKILSDRASGGSKGVGFVRFEYPHEAESAIKALNGVTLAGTSKPLAVRVAEKKDNNNNPLAGAFAENASILGGNMAAFARNARFNPMGYFPAQTPQLAQGYPQYGNGYPPAFPGYPPNQTQDLGNTFCLFVYNLPPESDEGYLYQLFGPYGAVATVKIAREQGSTLCKGFGFVNMAKYDDAQSAIAALNGAQIGSKTLQVSFKKDK